MLITHYIARINPAVVYEIIDRERKVTDQHTTFESVPALHRGVAAFDRPERATALEFDNTLPIRQPSDAEAITHLQTFGTDAVPLLQQTGLTVTLFGKVVAEFSPILEACIAAKHMKRTNLCGFITADTTPQAAQRILCYMLVGGLLYIAAQLRIIASAFDPVAETLFDGNPESRYLW